MGKAYLIYLKDKEISRTEIQNAWVKRKKLPPFQEIPIGSQSKKG